MRAFQLVRRCRAVGITFILLVTVLVIMGLVDVTTDGSLPNHPIVDPVLDEIVLDIVHVPSKDEGKAHPVPKLLQNTHLGACKASLDLLILVTSEPRNHEFRDVVRNTWGMGVSWGSPKSSQRPLKVEVVFVLGVDADPMWRTLVVEEARAHGDVIQFDLRHGEQHSVIQNMAPLIWVQDYCASFGNSPKYVMKCEDKSFVNVQGVLALVQHDLHTHAVIGQKVCSSSMTQARIYQCLHQTSYMVRGRLLPALETTEVMVHGDMLEMNNNLSSNWTCDPSAKLSCHLVSGKCLLASGLQTKQIDHLWSLYFSSNLSEC